jgi:hypothetical protein
MLRSCYCTAVVQLNEITYVLITSYNLYVFIVTLDSSPYVAPCAQIFGRIYATHVYCGLLHVHIILSVRNYTRTFTWNTYKNSINTQEIIWQARNLIFAWKPYWAHLKRPFRTYLEWRFFTGISKEWNSSVLLTSYTVRNGGKQPAVPEERNRLLHKTREKASTPSCGFVEDQGEWSEKKHLACQ